MFELTIHLDNEAMQIQEDVATALRALADRLERETASGLFQNVYDVNGNNVGTWKFKTTTNEGN